MSMMIENGRLLKIIRIPMFLQLDVHLYSFFLFLVKEMKGQQIKLFTQLMIYLKKISDKELYCKSNYFGTKLRFKEIAINV